MFKKRIVGINHSRVSSCNLLVTPTGPTGAEVKQGDHLAPPGAAGMGLVPVLIGGKWSVVNLKLSPKLGLG